MANQESRLRRARRTRAKIRELAVPRLTVHRSGQHTYAQVISPDGKVVASASTVQKDLREAIKNSGKNREAAALVGKTVAERAVGAGIKKVAFDRSGFAYMGRMRALADAAREAGLEF